MAEFGKAHAKTLRHEAGYANDSRDKGGETWAGVARKKNPAWAGWPIVDAAKQKLSLAETRDAPRHLLRDLEELLHADDQLAQLVAAFYRACYWDALALDREPSQAVAEKAYDIAVNMGVGIGNQFLNDARASGSNA